MDGWIFLKSSLGEDSKLVCGMCVTHVRTMLVMSFQSTCNSVAAVLSLCYPFRFCSPPIPVSFFSAIGSQYLNLEVVYSLPILYVISYNLDGTRRIDVLSGVGS